MDKTYLLIDFGASRIKSAIFVKDRISEEKSYPSVEPKINNFSKYEVSLSKIKDLFINIIESYSDYNIEGIFVCSEMHGFAILDKDNQPLSNYISWKDERAKDDFKKLVKKYGKNFLKKTGMKPKSCYPFFKIKSVMKELNLKDGKIVSLPEYLCTISDKSKNISNITISAGLGFYNIYKKCWDKDLRNIDKNFTLHFNKVVENIQVGGYYNDIPIYTGIGDLQAAVYGAMYGDNIINLNMGTGSQVITCGIKNKKEDFRPFFGSEILNVVTHIPSGRALNVYINFLQEINQNIDYWDKINNLTLSDIENSSLNFDLGVFPSARNFNNGGDINGIIESNFNLNNYLSSLVSSYLKQYTRTIDELIKDSSKIKTLVLTGGISGKMKVVKEYFEKVYNCDVIIMNNKIDETLLGLAKLSKTVMEVQ